VHISLKNYTSITKDTVVVVGIFFSFAFLSDENSRSYVSLSSSSELLLISQQHLKLTMSYGTSTPWWGSRRMGVSWQRGMACSEHHVSC